LNFNTFGTAPKFLYFPIGRRFQLFFEPLKWKKILKKKENSSGNIAFNDLNNSSESDLDSCNEFTNSLFNSESSDSSYLDMYYTESSDESDFDSSDSNLNAI
jgi:hypothetical protein